MAAGQYAAGLALTVVCLAPLIAAVHRLRAAAWPWAQGATAWMAEAVACVALLILVAEAIGVIGIFQRLACVVGCLVVATAVWMLGARLGPPASAPPRHERSRSRRAFPWVAIPLASVAAAWLGWTFYAYRHGMQSVDTLWYHLPYAARFVQLRSIVHLHYFDRDAVTVFYPADSELLHALGMLWFRSDLLSPLINLGWAVLAGLAAWSLGQRAARGPHCLLAALVVLATPTLVDTQPGGAYNDVACIALVLSAAALFAAWVRSRAGARSQLAPGANLLAAAAAGIAIGTKFTMIVPALTLACAAALVAGPRGRRLCEAALWIVVLLALGGLWYVRNWVKAGNPLPGLSLHVGPLALASPHVSTPIFTVAQYIFNPRVWHVFFIPGLRRALGLAWWALILGAIGGSIVTAVRGRDRAIRALGAVALISGLAFLLTPQFLGVPGAPIFFVYNVRYLTPALALGLVLLPAALAPGSSRAGMVLLVLLVLGLLFTELDPGVWPTGLHLNPFGAPIAGASASAAAMVCAIGSALVALRSRLRATTRPRWLGAVHVSAALIVLIAGGGWALARSYGHHRYESTQPLPTVYAFSQHLSHARIGLIGLDLQYPLYGRDQSNFVQYIGAPAPHAGSQPPATCAQWRELVDRGHYGWLLVTPFGFPLGTAANVAPETRWTETSPAAHAVLHETTGTGEQAILYRLSGALDTRSCR